MASSVFDSYKKPNNQVITSSVISETTEWYHRSLLIPHEPFRRDMIEVSYLLKNEVKPEEDWKLTNFFTWYEDRFFELIHHHHDIEEQIVFPFYSKKVKIPEKTSADHKELMKMLIGVKQIGEKFTGLGSNEIASKECLPLLQEHWEKLTKLMLGHFAEEEEQMVTFIKDAVTEKEDSDLVNSILKKQSLGDLRCMLPAIVYAMSQWENANNQANFMNLLPPPPKIILRVFWMPAYLKYHRGALESMRAGKERIIIKESKSWFFQ